MYYKYFSLFATFASKQSVIIHKVLCVVSHPSLKRGNLACKFALKMLKFCLLMLAIMGQFLTHINLLFVDA